MTSESTLERTKAWLATKLDYAGDESMLSSHAEELCALMRPYTRHHEAQLTETPENVSAAPVSNKTERIEPQYEEIAGFDDVTVEQHARDVLERTAKATSQNEQESVADATCIINTLVRLKDHKDKLGKDAFYTEAQPKAWAMARDFLARIKDTKP